MRLISLIFLFCALAAQSATYYVDYATGSDANNGAATATPWQHSPGDSVLSATPDHTFVTTSNFATASTGSSVTWNLTLQTNTEKGYIMVETMSGYDSLATNVTWNGITMTNIGGTTLTSSGPKGEVRLWGLPIGATTAGTYAVAVKFNSANPFAGSITLFDGVRQTNSFGTVSNLNTGGSTFTMGLTIPPTGYGVVALGSYIDSGTILTGNVLASTNNSGVALNVASTTQAGNQAFSFSVGGYAGSVVGVPLYLDSIIGPAATQLNPGDTVRFKGGVSYVCTAPWSAVNSGEICVNWSGTNGAPIIYDGNSDGSWGTGRAIFTDHWTTNHISAFYSAAGMTNIIFTSLEIGPVGGYDILPPTNGYDAGHVLQPNYGNGITAVSSLHQVTITNCYFHELGIWTNGQPCGDYSVDGGAIACSDAQSVTIVSNEFTKISNVISIGVVATTTNLVYRGNLMHDYIGWGLDIAVKGIGSFIDDVQVYGNEWRNCTKYYAAGYWHGYGGSHHQDPIFFRGSGVTGLTDTNGNYAGSTFVCGTNINFYNNLFWSDATTNASYGGGTAQFCPEGGVSFNFFNNVMSNCVEANAALKYESAYPWMTNQHVKIVNNTFYQTNGGKALMFDGVYTYDTNLLQNIPFQPTNTDYVVKNNLFYGPHGTSYELLIVGTNSVTGVFHFDFNCYYVTNGLGIGNWANTLGTPNTPADISTIANMRLYGWETNGFNSEPLLLNLRPQTNSPVILAGTNLTSLGIAALNVDKDGAARPTTSNWTIGAYQVAGTNSSGNIPPPGNTFIFTGTIHF